jgi:hypothetical protein
VLTGIHPQSPKAVPSYIEQGDKRHDLIGQNCFTDARNGKARLQPHATNIVSLPY